MNERLRAALDGYLELRCHLDPVEATSIGRHEFDGRFARYDQDSVREALAALRAYTSELEEAAADSIEDEIDRTAALHAARHDILVLERERPFARDPSFHLSHVLNGFLLLLTRESSQPVARAQAVLERLRALPEFLEAAKERLSTPSRASVRSAMGVLTDVHELIRYGLDDPVVDLTALEPLDLEDARVRALDGLMTFGEVLESLDESAGDDFAIGRDLFDRKLHTAHMIRENADELMRFGERLRERAEADLKRSAEEIAPGVHWREVAERLRMDIPTPETAISEYEDAIESAREFTITHRLLSVTPVELRVIPTPDFLQALSPNAPSSAYVGAGAYAAQQRGLLFVKLSPHKDSWHARCRAELPAVALRVGIPGQHQHVSVRNRLPQPVRRVIGTPATLEGWPLYCEQVMTEVGFLRAPEARFFAAYRSLWCALGLLLDISLHTRGLSREAAEATLHEQLGIDLALAEEETLRYCARPTYQVCGAVGGRDILLLRDDARQAAGDAFSLAAFHDSLLSYGALPTALARWGMGLA